MRSHWAAGNAKLKGKRHKLLRCGCCVVTDLRGPYIEKLAKQEIRSAERELTEMRRN